MSFKFMKKSAEPATTPELQLVENENLKHLAIATEASSAPGVEQKETYVNMINPSLAPTCSTEVVPRTIESPDEDEANQIVKNNRVKKPSRGPFRLKQLSLTRSKSKVLKSLAASELASASGEDKLNTERHKAVTSSTRSSRLKKFFMLPQADPSRKQQTDVSLKNLRHVL